ncbi:unnamed protein product [Protopolystoma xenopodis]|uniref:Uncharacterized protein n=1 Tax=Protopolystoma xenopodis TaxID=117903 RepID=A0A448WB87_9PLAT|nr:unnamed protein product [Protopolystoma xenopodis]
MCEGSSDSKRPRGDFDALFCRIAWLHFVARRAGFVLFLVSLPVADRSRGGPLLRRAIDACRRRRSDSTLSEPSTGTKARRPSVLRSRPHSFSLLHSPGLSLLRSSPPARLLIRPSALVSALGLVRSPPPRVATTPVALIVSLSASVARL